MSDSSLVSVLIILVAIYVLAICMVYGGTKEVGG